MGGGGGGGGEGALGIAWRLLESSCQAAMIQGALMGKLHLPVEMSQDIPEPCGNSKVVIKATDVAGGMHFCWNYYYYYYYYTTTTSHYYYHDKILRCIVDVNDISSG